MSHGSILIFLNSNRIIVMTYLICLLFGKISIPNPLHIVIKKCATELFKTKEKDLNALCTMQILFKKQCAHLKL